MRIAAIVAVVAVVQIGSASIAAQQPANGPSLQAKSLGNLFATRLTQPRDARLASPPAVVCGLTLIPGDPNVDPGIRHPVPEGGPRYAIRSVDP